MRSPTQMCLCWLGLGLGLAVLGLIACEQGGGRQVSNQNTNENIGEGNHNDNEIPPLPPPPPGSVGVCEGEICGPSAGFTVAEFPTIAEVDFAAFPANPSRPYQPQNGGRFWYVATTGDDSAEGTQAAPLASPEVAVARAATGDVILVGDGDYTVGSEEYNAVTLSVPGVTLAAENIGQVRFRPPANTQIVAIGIAATADDVIVDGFVIEGFRSHGVLFGRLDQPQRNLVLKHLVIHDIGDDGIRSEVPDVTPHPTPIIEGLLVYDVWIQDVPGVGINCGEGPCDDVRLEAIRVDMAGEAGGGSGADAVGFENGDNIVVFNTEVAGAAADGLDFKCTRVAVANVMVHDLARNGIKLWHGGDVINALVYNTDADAAIVVKVGRCRVLNSLVAYHALGGEAYSATVGYDDPTETGQLEVINTILYQNTGPMWVSSAYSLDVRNSIFLNSPYAAVAWGNLYVGDEGDTFAAMEAAGGGADNLGIVDPLLVNPQAGDFSLAAGSPARDAGTATVEAFPDFDLRGDPRVAGAGVDLGPLETQ
ncbi:MAG: choice-of-anchor Q domain-containing protein [Planctomycetota bacterium]